MMRRLSLVTAAEHWAVVVLFLLLSRREPSCQAFLVQQPISTNSPSSRGILEGPHWFQDHARRKRPSRHALFVFAKSKVAKTQDYLSESWFPREQKPYVYDDDIFADMGDEDETAELEAKAVELMARIIKSRLNQTAQQKKLTNEGEEGNDDSDLDPTRNNNHQKQNSRSYQLARGRFIDLATTEEGEAILEALFQTPEAVQETDDEVIQGAVMVLQSLLVFGTQVGVKGSPMQLQRMIAHLDSRADEKTMLRDLDVWDTESVRRLKYQINRAPAIQLLSEMSWKRTTQGAFDLLVALGVWQKHEDLPLIRSGFSLRFNETELEAAETASQSTCDPDDLLGLRKDLRHLKVYTVDSEDTSEIDDGISLEAFKGDDGKERKRIWVHIADSERWAPRDSEVFDIARRRITSLYLPQGSIPMLPAKMSEDIMSLKANTDVFALSLCAELLDDGSVDVSSIEIIPSQIRVSYRLTYDEVNEMLEEGIGYSEEWELGALLDLATKRRQYRIRNGSSEGFITNPIPQASISVAPDKRALDGVSVSLNVEVSHNAGANHTAAATGESSNPSSSFAAPVSAAHTLVTETMILAGEAIGRWKFFMENRDTGGEINGDIPLRNELRLPFRTQKKPDYTQRARERHIMNSLIEYNVGDGYCHAWYSRRFLSQVNVQEKPAPHSGLGLSCYVQWSSPIRRYSDFLVHICVKRYLRRERLIDLMREVKPIPALDELTEADIGCPIPRLSADNTGTYVWDTTALDEDINYREGGGLVGAARILQRQSQQYWLYEYIRRLRAEDPDVIFDAIVLGFVPGDPSKKQYAIYVYELGFEYRYTSPVDLKSGTKLKLKVAHVAPRSSQLTFVRINA